MSLRKEAIGTLSDGVIMVMFLGSETEMISHFKKFQCILLLIFSTHVVITTVNN